MEEKVKGLFGDLMMQVAMLQTALEEERKKREELEQQLNQKEKTE